MAARHKGRPRKVGGIEGLQAVEDHRVHIQVEDAVQRLGQQQRRRQPVIDLDGVAPRLGKALKQALRHPDQGAAVLGAQGRLHPGPVLPRQVGVEDVHVVMRGPAVAQDGGHALLPQGDEFAVDRKKQVHIATLWDIERFYARLRTACVSAAGAVMAASRKPPEA